ncbi:fasciclin domain-containing protein [Cellulomonas edaphi]|uniref:Fasciclin domain-containing protein n=1 Tax=Cellulomonas edaphi TaxID=3053468 RepID=A0ABT7S259_9CELL|nr:fasciclin domain-containing protein [Cellulomons edaphi]MDM7829712.1 fasciclin domain-containing protein [Cellulomons edaphi]
MSIRRFVSALAAASLATGAVVAFAPGASATARTASAPTGTTSLAAVLASDGNTFDRNWYDFDILDQAVGAVLAAKPDSPVAVLADGTVPLTAFIPTDRAFQLLAHDLTHRWYSSEQRVLTALAGAVGVDAIEQVLLYHVVPGATIDSKTALASDNAVLTTAQGGTIKVDVLSKRFGLVRLIDKDRNDVNPFLIPCKLDINKGNKQIAHAITFVLRPVDL